MVDGVVYAVSPIAVRAVDRSATLEGAGDGGVVPSVGIATGGTWAVARGTNVALVDRGSTTNVDVGATVRALAIWHGDVWVATGDHLTRIPRRRRHPRARPRHDHDRWGARLFGDGGRLWVVSPHAAVSIDRDQEPTVFTLAAVDVDLCVGDCSTQALLDYLGAAATSTTAVDRLDRRAGALRDHLAAEPADDDHDRLCDAGGATDVDDVDGVVGGALAGVHAGCADHHRRGDPGHRRPCGTAGRHVHHARRAHHDPCRGHHDHRRHGHDRTAAPPPTRPPAPPITRPPATNTPSTAAPTSPATGPPTSATLPTDHRAGRHGAAIATPGRRHHPGPRVDRWR